MSFRRFTDRNGQHWDVRDRSKAEWVFEPVLGNPSAPRRVKPPGYESDPFELTDQDLRRLLDESGPWHPEGGPPRKSPFLD